MFTCCSKSFYSTPKAQLLLLNFSTTLTREKKAHTVHAVLSDRDFPQECYCMHIAIVTHALQ